MANSSPIVEAFRQILFINAFTQASNLFDVTDPDGDPITRYRFFDFSNNPDTGFFELNGSPKANGAQFEIAASQLSNLFYIAGSQVGAEFIRVQAYDGKDWSEPAVLKAYTVRENVTRPEIETIDTTVLGNEFIQVAGFINATDPDGWPIEKLQLRDRRVTHSYFSLDGVKQTQGQFFEVTEEEFQRLEYHGFYKGSEFIDVRAWDGAQWSFLSSVNVETILNANRPVGQYSRHLVPVRDDTVLDGLLSWIDADGNTAKKFRFYDTNAHAHSGYIVANGVRRDAKEWIQVNAEDLENTYFVGAERAYIENIRFRVYDGRYWSPVETLAFDNTPTPRLAGPKNAVVSQLVRFEVAPMFTQGDRGPEHISFEIFDSNTSDISGRFEMDGIPYEAGVIHQLSGAEFAQLDFRSGTYEDRSYDEVYVRAWNGLFHGEWTRAKMRSEPEYDKAMFSGTDWNQYIIDRTSDNKTVITYSFMQTMPDYEVGEAVDFSRFTPDQRRGVRRAFRHLETFANVKFLEVADSGVDPVSSNRGGTVRMGNYFLDSSNTAAFAFLPSEEPEAGDIWVNTFHMSTEGWNEGSFEYFVYLHELGHAMGLLHPFGDPPLPPGTDSTQYTVMSYTDGPAGYSWGYQLYDISEIQRLYDPNETHASGDDVYDINTLGGNDSVWSIWDIGGVDEISAVGSTINAVVDLRSGSFSSIGTIENNLSIAFGVEIENGTGGQFNDTITGNEKANVLVGNAGDDIFRGMGGNDIIRGNAGSDTYLFGIGDGQDIIDEAAGAGRDRLVIQDFPGLDDLTEDLTFRFANNALTVDLTIDGERAVNRVTIQNQGWGRYQIETLEIGGLDIDLVNLTSQATAFDQTFRALGDTSVYGHLVVPI